jgi:Xaa-Pro dipeptidase
VAAVEGLTYTGLPQDEIERRYRLIREAAARDGLDAVIVCGNEYTGFEGAVTYLSGFVIVHRYAYVLLPIDGDPTIVFPTEARYVGEHGTTWIDQQEFVDRPGEWLADAVRGKRAGVYGMDYVMTVRDHAALQGACELVAWDTAFDHARVVKSELELASVRESVRINTEGFWIFLEHFEPGKSEREVLAPCEEYFVAQGCGRWTMDMVLDGPNGAALPEFKIAGAKRFAATDCVLPSLEVAGPGGHWVEVSRAICPGEPSDDTKRMLDAYDEYFDAARTTLRSGSTARDAHRAVAKGFLERGFHLGHVTGHSIGMTMIEFPKIGEADETELQAGMVLSMHPHAIAADGQACLYMQDTWLVTDAGGVPLADLPMKIFDGSESRPERDR